MYTFPLFTYRLLLKAICLVLVKFAHEHECVGARARTGNHSKYACVAAWKKS